MTTLTKRPIGLSKNKTRKNIKNIWSFYDQTKVNINDTNAIAQEIKTNECCLKSSNLITSADNFITCSICGTTETNLIDSSPEWRFYNADDSKRGSGDPNRCGIPFNPMLENNLTCSFQSGHPAQFKKNISTLIRYTNSSNFSYKDKTVLENIKCLNKLGALGNFTQRIIDSAIIIHKEITTYLTKTDVHFRAENKESILYGDFDLACKLLDVPRTAKEFSTTWNCDIQTVTSGCKIVQTIYAQIEQNIHDSLKITSKHTNPSSFIHRFCSNLQITDTQFMKMCLFILSKVGKINTLNQHTPQSIAAGTIIFIATYSNILPVNFIHKDQVSKAVGVSDVTISKINTKLMDHHKMHKLIPTKLVR